MVPAVTREMRFPKVNKCHANEICEETLPLCVAIKRSTLIGSFTSGIKTPFQLTTLNVMGALCDLFDVSMDIYTGNLPREM